MGIGSSYPFVTVCTLLNLSGQDPLQCLEFFFFFSGQKFLTNRFVENFYTFFHVQFFESQLLFSNLIIENLLF
jgi:hypothetical protein